ncbi:MAG: L-ribulose-5-phosphate 4-epimerase AraD [Chloroflexi bacterium]|nr:L-ribulose-5-phosphate 4-epimerase AraD [Chloroflexota bacterium]
MSLAGMDGADLERLRVEVCEANRALVAAGLVTLSFGNASGVDRERGIFVIKPSGVPYERLRPADMVVVGIGDGRAASGSLRPSSDTPTHAELYRRFPAIGGIVHTHSAFATAWAQAGRPIPCLGTTHADHFSGPVPVTRQLTDAEIDGDYELETGALVASTIEALGLDADAMPAALVASHGPFCWGVSVRDAVTNAIALEAVAALAHRTLALDPSASAIDERLRARHFRRKHGPGATYGQASSDDGEGT